MVLQTEDPFLDFELFLVTVRRKSFFLLRSLFNDCFRQDLVLSNNRSTIGGPLSFSIEEPPNLSQSNIQIEHHR